MIIIKLWGGLGNQLFQYAFGYALSQKYKQELAIDLSFYENQPGNVGKRNIDINNMNIMPYEKFSATSATKLLNNRYIGVITRNLPCFKIKIGKELFYFKEPIHKYVRKIPEKNNIYFDGYWQSSKYFAEYKEDLVKMFTPHKELHDALNVVLASIKNENSVAVHMRKGDFGKGTVRKVGHLLPVEYYHNAIEYCKVHLNYPIFYVFTDDVEWAKQILGEENDMRYISEICKTDALTDLYIISKCRNGIMSASTFSWWGNWLRSDMGLVIAPKGNYYNEFFYEDAWIRLE